MNACLKPLCLMAALVATTLDFAAGQPARSLSFCVLYEKSVQSADPVPREMLKDWPSALTCLVDIIRGLKGTVVSVETASSRKDLLNAAKALRVILDENTEPAISRFREIDDIGVASVLTFAARVPNASDPSNRDLRLNSTLVLGNVIDNRTVCIPLDHLFDPAIDSNGRANLIAIVSVVASWALRENLDNMERMLAQVKRRVDASSPDTLRILTGLETKIAVRKQTVDIDRPRNAADLLRECKSYVPIWAGESLRY